MIPLVRTLGGVILGWAGARLLGLLARFRVGQTAVTKRTSRRMFTRNAALGAVGVVLAETAAGFYFFFNPNKTGAFGGDVSVSKSVVPAIGAEPYKDPQGKFYLVHNEDGLLALYWKCVHLGCTVPWVPGEKQFHCPCHGSIYDPNGVRLAGPAPRPLDQMAVTVTPSGDVTVATGKITQRSGYAKSQAVPYTA